MSEMSGRIIVGKHGGQFDVLEIWELETEGLGKWDVGHAISRFYMECPDAKEKFFRFPLPSKVSGGVPSDPQVETIPVHAATFRFKFHINDRGAY